MKKVLALLAALAVSLTGASAFAYSVKVDDDTFASVGFRSQVRFQMTNPDSTHDRVEVLGTQGRIYGSGQITNLMKFGMNFDMSRGRAVNGTPNGTSTSLSDMAIWFDIAKELKVHTGIYRMAFSRKALQDTYQTIFVTQPDVAASSLMTGTTGATGSGLAGYRGAGLTFWGDLADGMLRYNVGFWDGDYAPAITGSTNPNDEIGYTARLVLNLMDPEKGYTCAGCYLGKAKIMNIGLGYMLWKDQVEGTRLRDLRGTTVDFYYDANNATVEAAYYMYDYDEAGQKPSAYYVELGYAIDKIQPGVRFEQWDNDDPAGTGASGNYRRYTGVLNYLIDGHNAKVQLEAARRDPKAHNALTTDTYILQLQVQF